MDAHLTDDVTEFGYSGRSYARAETLDVPGGVTDEPRGAAHRASHWRQEANQWFLAFHQGTPVG